MNLIQDDAPAAAETPEKTVLNRVQLLSVLPPATYQHLLHRIDEAVLVVDHKGRLLEVNLAAERLLRRLSREQPTTFIGSMLEDALGTVPWPGPELVATTGTEYGLTDIRRSGIDLRINVSPLHDREHRCVGLALVARDVTDLNRQRAELDRANGRLHEQLHAIELLRADLADQAVHDHLTGLYNRRHLINELAAAVQYAGAAGSELSVALLDIDGFRRINDRYGAAVADGVLAQVATMISGAVLPGEVVARHGGQEFALILPGVAPARAAAYVDALRQLIRGGDLLVDGQVVPVRFSAGVAGFTGSERVDDLLRDADAALYAAKQGGRDRVHLATDPTGCTRAARFRRHDR